MFPVIKRSLYTTLLCLFVNISYAAWQEDTGRADLLNYLKLSAIPSSTTSAVPISMTEANSFNDGDPDNIIELRYLPLSFPNTETETFTPTSGSYSGITFTNGSIGIAYDEFNNYNGILLNTISGHASTVAANYFSQSTYATGVTDITCYEASNFINTISNDQVSLLNSRVMSHAWVSRFIPTTTDDIEYFANAINRFDYLASTGNTVMVVGVDNGSSTAVPTLWGLAYNSVQVGVTDGDHSAGDTSNALASEGLTSARTRPDIVSNNSFTSYATGQVASGATYIHGLANTLSQSEVTSNTDVQRAILLAGATKEEFPSWENMSTNPSINYPLDPTYGAGEMNIFHSHRIVEGGNPLSSNIAYHGWDRASVGSNTETYNFTISPEVETGSISLVLCWNREVSENTSGFGPFRTYSYDPEPLADLKVELAGGSLITPIVCDSPLDNVEHIYYTNLTPGTYQVTVSNNNGNSRVSDYGLAWRINVKSTAEPCYTLVGNDLNMSNLITGLTYEVEESSNMTDWDYVNSFTATSSTHTWINPSPVTTDRHFYRLKYWK